MTLPEYRKSEIERKIDSVLKPYEANLVEFSLEDIRKEYDIFIVCKGKGVYPGSKAMVFQLPEEVGQFEESNVVAIEPDVDPTPELIGHELGHIVLGHSVKREIEYYGKPLSELSSFCRWVIEVEKKPLGPAHKFGDTPLEREEANYFSQYWNKRLEGVDWLRNTEIVDMDEFRHKKSFCPPNA